MVPTSLILAILVAAFLPASFGYIFSAPRRRLRTPYFVGLAGPAALMVLLVALGVFSVRIVWLSWALLVIAILQFAWSIKLMRRGWAMERERARAMNEERMRGG